MTDPQIFGLLFVLYLLNFQWAFRCQRVGRGILLLAKDSLAQHRALFSSIMPGRYVASIWLGRILFIAAAIFAWRSLGWLGLVGLILSRLAVAALVDRVSPWPSYRRLLRLVRTRVIGRAEHPEALSLLPAISHVEAELDRGVHFEAATAGAWVERAAKQAAAEDTATNET